MNSSSRLFLFVASAAVLALRTIVSAETAEPELVNIKTIDPSILIDLRYATEKNFTHRALYPAGFPALVRPSVAQRLVEAQKFLRARGYGLKIWDAYRPKNAQQLLWEATQNGSYVANPSGTVGSMHTRGVAVDATLVDNWGRDIEMPTEFDSFTPAAMLIYRGNNPVVQSHLTILQRAMARNGFYGLRTEWWHFCAEDWKRYPPIASPTSAAEAPTTSL